MNEPDLEQCRALLEVTAGAAPEEIERAFMRKNFALIKGGTEEDRLRLRAAHDALLAAAKAEQDRQTAASPRVPGSLPPPARPAGLLTPPVLPPRAPGDDTFVLFAFDNWKVNVLVPPLLFGLTWLANASPLGSLLTGFHVWMHEFGHATAAWLTGRRATPLPFGWTPIEPDYSPFVYFGLLFLLGVLFAAGWKERKVWPMLAAVALGVLQYHMTWRLRLPDQEFWWTFGGVGGEFYLSALFMAFYFVELPEKFRWGACRYVFFLIGATAFLNIYLRWDKVYHGLEEIPFGTLINGEEYGGGDMNKLMDDFGWTKALIRHRYHLLGQWCLAGLGVVYGAFALRLNRLPDLLLAARARRQPTEDGSS